MNFPEFADCCLRMRSLVGTYLSLRQVRTGRAQLELGLRSALFIKAFEKPLKVWVVHVCLILLRENYIVLGN